jgi:hypothetical protein
MRRLVVGLALFSLCGVLAVSSADAQEGAVVQAAHHAYGKQYANSGRGLISRRPACPSCKPGYAGGFGHGYGYGHGFPGHHAFHQGGSMLPGGGIHYRPPTEPAGGPVGTYAYPYYTIRGPRDFLMANPPSIGPY